MPMQHLVEIIDKRRADSFIVKVNMNSKENKYIIIQPPPGHIPCVIIVK